MFVRISGGRIGLLKPFDDPEVADCVSKTVLDQPRAQSAECMQVREHGAALRMGDVRKNSKLSEAELQKHEEGFARASETYLDSCVKKRSHNWARCMLKRTSLKGAKSCD